MDIRRNVVAEQPTTCLGSSRFAHSAVRELYEEVMLNVLPQRYPSMFRIKYDVSTNVVTGLHHCVSEALEDPLTMLRHLAENVEEDFYLVYLNDEEEYVLIAFASCFPQGLLPPAKIGLTVSQIHEPLPDYEQRLKKGVNLCFRRMARGESVGRVNVRFWRHSLEKSEC